MHPFLYSFLSLPLIFSFSFRFVHNVTDHNSNEIAERERGLPRCGGCASNFKYIYKQNLEVEALQSQNLSHPFQATNDTYLKNYAGKGMSLMFAFTTQCRTNPVMFFAMRFVNEF
jgi:hypothetical protein